MNPGIVTDAASLELGLEPLPADQVVQGSPATGFAELGEFGGIELGVWEHTPGASTDVEADEVFIVLSGSATVSFDDPALEPIELRAGSVARLTAGMHTVWTVSETLRKVYIAG
ncbi:putative cupin superfamily protein [Microbacterium trichothecenolyticum]|uniref:cupin domain-containing protein n=1 Tax=Microbacterium trichothecenolyticum TaxID=69370 RepID=UPI00286530A9|nr:cupin domain-containing protein [Microbacterium trichothecenolyticum]MDR7184764.1 putative cupin superfamily protein [Microbacterium trichothecenolyticum]